MLNALERGVKGNKWFSLIDKVASERTLGIAWEKVRTNAGACGVDRTGVTFFAKDSQKRLLAVKEQLMENTYHPQAIRRVEIPKPDSTEKRPLGIPTVRDRVVQTAVKLVIEPIFEREFAPQSYGFRPGRGCKDALREVEGRLREGYRHVVDVDIKGYFDNIPHEPLMKLVKERISDGRVIELIEKFLKQGVSPKSQRKLRMNLKRPTRRANGKCLPAIIATLNPKLRGWFNYFEQAHVNDHRKMDQWVRMRLRLILRKRHKGKGCGRGWDHFKWPNRYFKKHGLFSLEQAHVERLGLHRGENR